MPVPTSKLLLVLSGLAYSTPAGCRCPARKTAGQPPQACLPRHSTDLCTLVQFWVPTRACFAGACAPSGTCPAASLASAAGPGSKEAHAPTATGAGTGLSC